MNSIDFRQSKGKRKLSLVTCYDATFARIIQKSGIDAILVGDSGSMVMAGRRDTTQATLADLCFFTGSVCRGAPEKLIIADMPFLSFRKSTDAGMSAAEELIRSGAHAVKLEGVRGHENLIERLVQSGIPVMGHLGLTPQHIHQLGGYKVQGREQSAAKKILDDALLLEQLGVFSMVLECVPNSLASEITQQVQVPTVGIGAGPDTDGQILVLHDLLGLNTEFKPKFVRQFLDGAALVQEALQEYQASVEKGQFPATSESYL